jgi:hypothetical protein
MARTIKVETGNDQFVISVDQIPGDVKMTFHEATAVVNSREWLSLLRQVKTRSLSKWKFTKMEDPMGKGDFQRLLAEVNTTPAYQLFLAGFDIAVVVGLVSEPDDQVVLSRCISISGGNMPHAIGPRKLFVISDRVLQEGGDAINALVLAKKLCRLTATIGQFEPVIKYYIPYIPQSGVQANLSPEANALWDRIRDFYYAFR